MIFRTVILSHVWVAWFWLRNVIEYLLGSSGGSDPMVDIFDPPTAQKSQNPDENEQRKHVVVDGGLVHDRWHTCRLCHYTRRGVIHES